jgi:hypothetical protein
MVCSRQETSSSEEVYRACKDPDDSKSVNDKNADKGGFVVCELETGD